MNSLQWRNIRIGLKYSVIFIVMAVTFLMSIFITYHYLTNSSNQMEETKTKNDVSIYAGDLVTSYDEKYLLIPEYILLSDEGMLTNYLEASKEFVETAKKMKPHLTEEQLPIFNKMIENNDELDQYFFSTVVPNVQNINKNEFQKLQQSAGELKNETVQLGEQLKESAIGSSKQAIDSVQSDLKKTMVILVASTAIAILISFVLLIVISRPISKNLKKIVLKSEEIASGHLNTELLDYEGKDEIGQLSTSINHMSQSLRTMISEVSSLSAEVDHQSAMLFSSSEEVKIGSEQVSSTIEDMAQGASSQADNAAAISQNTKEFSTDIVKAGGHSKELVLFSDQVLEASISGHSQMTESMAQMNRIHTVMDASLSKIKSLEAKTHSITDIVGVIKSIADQTNLLALNASIESARAGDAGKGFAVVAAEVKKLSEEVARSVGNITDIVFSIKTETAEISGELNNGYTEVSKGSENMELTGQNFASIKERVEEMADKVNDISSVFDTIERSSKEINESVEQIAAISEESAAGSEEISATVLEQAQSVDTISQSAKKLTGMVEQMNAMIQKFKL
ncbi:methyl-accepting chemotaxis protein [Domibacillus epiphyticus]|uniref:Methyl-accepting chemotaxis protein n=1 Tax=Domibacillus epiphyticus TaxID=1714355 RepID=A0A1V2A744_9BACI|nr:HAMP domain-containing methyl-accepting chemotaxis protein [Domibacillus epiphyticus]OMP66654.1 methyl-accepting chemotaxis protein [Domibacillus epiphyticus]